MNLHSLLLAKHCEAATPHRRLEQQRYKPTWLDILDLAAYGAALIIVIVAFRVLLP